MSDARARWRIEVAPESESVKGLRVRRVYVDPLECNLSGLKPNESVGWGDGETYFLLYEGERIGGMTR